MISGIYKIVSPTGKTYIGQSIDLVRRKKEYAKLQCKKQKRLYYSLNMYGWDRHKWYEYEYPIDELDKAESEFKLEIISTLGWEYALFHEIYDKGGGPKSESTRKLISESNKGKHILTPEQINQRVKTRKETIKNNGGFDWGHKIAASQTGVDKPNKWKKVTQYDRNGTFIKTWESVKAAELFYSKNPDKDNISACARGNQKSAYGFIWKYI